MSDFFVIRAPNNTLAFPTFDDHPETIRPAFELVDDSFEFCERMGFPVEPDPACYNGVPVASKLHLRNKNKRATGDKPRNKVPVHWTVAEVLAFFTRDPTLYMHFVKGIGGICVFIGFLHLFNRREMALGKEEQERRRERLAREKRQRAKEELRVKL